MPLYRIVGKIDIERAQTAGAFEPTPVGWAKEYPPRSVVFVFNTKQPFDALRNFAWPVAKSREVGANEFVYLLEISEPTAKMESDSSQSGWVGSFAHFGPIANDKVKVIGDIIVTESRGTYRAFGEIRKYKEAILIPDFKSFAG